MKRARYQQGSSHAGFRPQSSHAGFRPQSSHAGFRPQSRPAGYQQGSSCTEFPQSSRPAGYQQGSSHAGFRPQSSHAGFRPHSRISFRRKSSTMPATLPNYGFENLDSRFDKEDKAQFEKLYAETVGHRETRWKATTYAKHPRSSKMKRFVRKGIPPAMRAEYWMIVSGRAEAMEKEPNRFKELLAKDIGKDLINAIDTDVPRTFPENKFFASNGTKEQDMLNDKLRQVLRAFAAAMPEVGYCQGLNFVAAVILLVVKNTEESFWLLEYLIKDVVPPGYYKPSMKELKRDCDVLSCLVKEKLPKLSERLDKEGISFVVICTKWFICLYCDTLPFETSLRVLDCLFYEGDKILFRVGLTLLQVNARDLEKNCKTFPQLLTAIQKMVQDKNTLFCHDFMQRVFSAPGSLSRKKIEKLRLQCEEKHVQTNANTP